MMHLLVFGLYELLLGSVVFAASSGTLIMSGSVAAVNSLTIVPNGTNNTTLNILAGETAKNVASVSETSNDSLGYKIFMGSTNTGKLQLTSDPTKLTTYQISYSGAAYTTPGTVAAPVQVKNVTSLTALTTNNSAVLVNVVAAPSSLAGSYSDTITFSIVGN